VTDELISQYQVVGEEGDLAHLVTQYPIDVIQGFEYREAVDGRQGVDTFESEGPFE